MSRVEDKFCLEILHLFLLGGTLILWVIIVSLMEVTGAKDKEYSEWSIKRMAITHTFVVEFCFAVETTFITALLVEYAMESIIDSFIWIIPNILIILLKPYYQHYLQDKMQSPHSYVNNSIACLVLAGAGNLIVVLSTYPQFFIHKHLWWFYHFLRIIISATGWTLVDVSLDFVSRNRDRMLEDADEDTNKQSLKVGHIAQILAFLLAFHACDRSPSWTNFHIIVDVLYITAAILCFSVAIISCFERKVLETLRSLNPFNMVLRVAAIVRNVPLRRETFLPGYLYTKSAPWNIKSHLLSIFCCGYVVDIILIYSCMWFVWAIGSHQEELTSSMLITGLKFGSFFLALFSMNGYLLKRFCFSFSTEQLNTAVLMTLIGNIVATGAAIWSMHLVSIACVVMMGSTLKHITDIYFDKVTEEVQGEFKHFDECGQLVSNVQQVFTLSSMPFFWMIIMKDDDTHKCLYFSLIALLTMLFLHFNRRTNKAQHKQKEQ